MTHVFIFNGFQLQDMSLSGVAWESNFMTYDRERYRKHLAPLNLPKDNEDQLLDQLWAFANDLARQSCTLPTYPLQFALAAETFEAIEQAIALASSNTETQTEKEEPCL